MGEEGLGRGGAGARTSGEEPRTTSHEQQERAQELVEKNLPRAPSEKAEQTPVSQLVC